MIYRNGVSVGVCSWKLSGEYGSMNNIFRYIVNRISTDWMAAELSYCEPSKNTMSDLATW